MDEHTALVTIGGLGIVGTVCCIVSGHGVEAGAIGLMTAAICAYIIGKKGNGDAGKQG